MTTITTESIVNRERTDVLEALGKQRFFLRYTVRDLTDAQAALAPTASVLSLAGLIKHVTSVEKSWIDFVIRGAEGMAAGADDRDAHFRMLEGDTLVGLLDAYADVARRTDELVAALPDLDVSHPLPEAPWFEPGASWSARRVLLHILGETAQHAGHADIIRESIDGARTMG